MEMKYWERSCFDDNGTAQEFHPREQLGKEFLQEHEKKEGDEENERGSRMVEESPEKVSELPEEYFHGLEDLPWNLTSLEQCVYLSLPVWLQAAMLCNLAGQYGIWTFHNNFLPCRLISYLLLPYTFPAMVMISFSYSCVCALNRLLCWTRYIVKKAVSVLTCLTRTIFTMLHLTRHLLDRSNHCLESSGVCVASCPPSTTPTVKSSNQHPLPSSSTLK